jgi:hypothetical protein
MFNRKFLRNINYISLAVACFLQTWACSSLPPAVPTEPAGGQTSGFSRMRLSFGKGTPVWAHGKGSRLQTGKAAV